VCAFKTSRLEASGQCAVSFLLIIFIEGVDSKLAFDISRRRFPSTWRDFKKFGIDIFTSRCRYTCQNGTDINMSVGLILEIVQKHDP
jgi:hypothetical protein